MRPGVTSTTTTSLRSCASREWLSETGLTLTSVHAPIAESLTNGQWEGPLSNALGDNTKRQKAVRETEAALQIARRIPFRAFRRASRNPCDHSQPGDNNRASAFRSADEICRLAEPFGIRVALEVIPNDISSAASLVSLIEQDLNAELAGICLDFGHAHLMGDVADTIETAAEHVVATHVHDNRRRSDDHLVPYLGSINWDMALMTMQKIGYEGTYLMELSNTSAPETVLDDARRARRAVRADAGTFMTAYIQDIAQYTGQSVTLKGWLHNRRSSGKIHFLTVRDGTGFIQCVMSKQAVGDDAFKQADHLAQETSIVVEGTVRADSRAPGGFEIDVTRLQVVSESENFPISPKEHGVDFLMDRRHLWIRSQRQQAILRVRHEVINAVRDFFNEPRLHPRRHADLHAGGVRGDDDAVSGAVLRRTRPPI